VKKKILIVIPAIRQYGGAEKVATTLAYYLDKQKFDIQIVTFYHEYMGSNFPLLKVGRDVNYYTLGKKIYLNHSSLLERYLHKIYRIFAFVYIFLIGPFILRKICLTNEINTILSFNEDANLVSILTKKLLNNETKLIVSLRINPFEMYKLSILSIESIFVNLLINQITIKFLFKNADRIVTNSKGNQQLLLKNTSLNNKVITINNQIDIDCNIKKAKIEISQEHVQIFKNKFVFINISRLHDQKGQYFLIRSFYHFIQSKHNAVLLIIGDDVQKDKLNQLIQDLDLSKYVFLFNFQPNIFPYLERSDCFILSSLWEGLPNVLIEALSMDIPIISTDCQHGPREILCPEINTFSKINYPYFGQFGILISTFKRDLLWKNDINNLSLEEIQLSKLFGEILHNQNILDRYRDGNNFKRAIQFDKRIIINKWEKLLLEL
jgi:glycosyltransferase involved in cell wall biosynthesis